MNRRRAQSHQFDSPFVHIASVSITQILHAYIWFIFNRSGSSSGINNKQEASIIDSTPTEPAKISSDQTIEDSQENDEEDDKKVLAHVLVIDFESGDKDDIKYVKNPESSLKQKSSSCTLKSVQAKYEFTSIVITKRSSKDKNTVNSEWMKKLKGIFAIYSRGMTDSPELFNR